MEGTYYACRPFQYGPDFPADMIDLHQVFEMRNEQNDEALLRLRYAAPLAPKVRLHQCGPCGKKFFSEMALTRHGMIRHSERESAAPKVVDDSLPPIDTNDPAQLIARARLLRKQLKDQVLADGFVAPNPDAEADQRLREEEKLLNEIAPIPWDKTKAAVAADDVKVPNVKTSVRRRAKPRKRRRAARKAASPQQEA